MNAPLVAAPPRHGGARVRRRARGADRVRGRRRIPRSTRASRRSSPTCARAATRRCSSTRGASTASTRRRWPRSRSRPRRCAPRYDVAAAAQRDALGAGRGAHPPLPRAAEGPATGASPRPTARELGQRVTPLDRVGIYVPGGKAAYPSSVLMNAIPAHVAGVREIVMVVPTPDGVRNPLVLAAAHLAGVTRVFTIGGAQAIAALAYGTQTVPAVDKICGPGNAYVAAAKRRVFGAVGIDMVAGVSEIVVVADGTANPDWIALDLFCAGRARRDGAGDPASRPTRRCIDARRGERAAADRGDAARGDHRGVVRAPRRADQDARPGRGVRDRQPHRARAPRARGRRSRRAAAADPPRGRHLHRPLCVRGARRLLRRARTTCCPRAAPRASARRSASTISRSARACCRMSRAAAQTLGPVAATLAHGEGLIAHARSAEARIDEP